MSGFEQGLLPDVDTLSPWIARRHRAYHAAGQAWAGVAMVAALLALLDDDLLLLPLVPVTAVAGWGAWRWGTGRWWATRSRRAGYPVVRADVSWTAAAGRDLPPGWLDTAVPGELHRTPDAWMWRPSRWVAVDLPARSWPLDEVAVVTFTPVGDAVAARAQVRLYLAGGARVDLLARNPARLLAAARQR